VNDLEGQLKVTRIKVIGNVIIRWNNISFISSVQNALKNEAV